MINRIIYFLHIHKSGGSYICNLARVNEMQSNYKQNCNVQADQRCCGNDDSLDGLENFAHSTPYNFVANERYMFNTMHHMYYYYITTVRDPMARYLSHYKHVAPRYSFKVWLYGQPDNWYTRHLCGMKCATIPKYGLNVSHYQTAKYMLAGFDAVIPLNASFEREYNKMAKELGWNHTLNKNKYSNKRNYKFDTSSIRDYQQYLMTGLDGQLFKFAPWGSQMDNYVAHLPKGKIECGNKCTKYL